MTRLQELKLELLEALELDGRMQQEAQRLQVMAAQNQANAMRLRILIEEEESREKDVAAKKPQRKKPCKKK